MLKIGICPKNCIAMNLLCTVMALGVNMTPMAMSGFLELLMAMTGNLICMEDGSGTLFLAGPGFLMNHLAGVFITMADGNGILYSAGTGFLQDTGDLLG